ncbi:unnamed protein product [Heligmosomoides polygyrus]|uniref:Regulator of nonsense transcripts 2 n=1 Tax=Heligmosomoides polygyrus TaxID=6339 RepID=A0A183F264_HELPZ|nr:unnamed protein product [Heligmosomoides polygyrus]
MGALVGCFIGGSAESSEDNDDKSKPQPSDDSSKEVTSKKAEQKDSDDSEGECENTKKKKPKKRRSLKSHTEKAEKDNASSSDEEYKTSEKDTSGKKDRTRKKGKKNDAPQDAAAIRLSELKKMALEKEMERRGLTPPFTMEACKAFKLRKEQEAGLAELAKNQIIDVGDNQKGRVTRGQRSAALANRRHRGLIFAETTDEYEEDEEREQIKQETQNMFKNLRGIVSDDAESD